MIVSHKYKFVFAEIPKNASRAIGEMLIRDYEGVRYDVVPFPHPKVGFYEKTRHSVSFVTPDYFYFGVIRNPYDRAISIYRHICLHGVSDDFTFEKFSGTYLSGDWVCNHAHACMVYNQVDFEKNVRKFDCVLKFDQLPVDLLSLPFIDKKIKLPNHDIEYRNYSDYYTSSSKKAVLSWAEEDFNRFGYDKIWKSII